MFRVYLTTALLLLISFSSFSFTPKDDKRKDDETTAQIVPVYNEGVIYALPRTGFEIEVKTKETKFVPGPYAQYAQKYLGIENVKTTKESNCEITAIKIKSFSEADPNAIFKTNDSEVLPISTLSSGVISGIGTPVDGSDIMIQGTDFITASSKTKTSFTDLSSDDFYDILVDTETGTETMEQKSLETKAREAADFLIRLRKKRAYNIISASDVVPEDGKGYEVFVKEAIRLEKIYTELFTGKTQEYTHSYTFNFIPESNVRNEILFRFSDEKGVLPKTDVSGKPILLNVIKDNTAASKIVELKKSENPEAKAKGIYYRVPANASITISDGLNTLYSGKTALPQLGEVVPVPENILDGSYKIEYNTQSGTLKSIEK